MLSVLHTGIGASAESRAFIVYSASPMIEGRIKAAGKKSLYSDCPLSIYQLVRFCRVQKLRRKRTSNACGYVQTKERVSLLGGRKCYVKRIEEDEGGEGVGVGANLDGIE